ncbi:MAG TPA: GGDEF domain-containing protein [Thermoanaerobaculia bacterium]|nr:GGDEF domain-containing protein [Thermoanaerobaculia bacterium]
MNVFLVGQLVHTIGAALLGAMFLYLSRSGGNRALHAAGVAWAFLSLSLASLIVLSGRGLPLENFLFQYWKLFFVVALVTAARRLDRQVPLARPLTITALAALPLSFALVSWAGSGPVFYAIHSGLLAIAWAIVAVFIFISRSSGLGKQFAAVLAVATAAFQAAYALFYGLAGAGNGHVDDPFLLYAGFYDLFLEMLFGIGLIIWAMEETEARLSVIHARAIDDTRRRKRLALIDPLTEVYNRYFFDEIRPSVEREAAGGSVVLVDVDELKTINDTEGHEEGDKAIWTIATGIKKLIRGADFLIRWGGDEFLVILPGMDEDLAKKRFYMLPGKLEEVRQAPRLKDRAYHRFLAASVGVAHFSRRIPLEQAIEKADGVMYERKKAHKEMRG